MGRRALELGVYSFGNTPIDPLRSDVEPTAVATRNLLEAIRLADEVGLDYFGIGEHHANWAPMSAAPVVLAAAASVTKHIRLGSSVTVLSTEDPVRVFQQFATLDALSEGRAEIIAGRGSSTESFPLFGHDLCNYDSLFAEKLDLLLRINSGGALNWTGRHRAPLANPCIVPRPHNGRLDIWLGTGGNTNSSVRAGQLGLPVSYAIIGGQVDRFAPLIDMYRRTSMAAGFPSETRRVAIASPGFIGENGGEARDLWWRHWQALMDEVAANRGFRSADRHHYDHETADGGALFVGSPEEIAKRIVTLHGACGHARHVFQMDIGHLSQSHFLRSIELLGTRVKPLVEATLGSAAAPPERESVGVEMQQ